MQREGEGATVRQARLIAVVGIFLIGCSALLLAVGCSGTRSEAPKEQGHTEATNKEQGHSGAASEEEARCEQTRTYQKGPVVRGHRNVVTTNDLTECPKGGLLLGTDERDKLDGREHGDEIRGLGGSVLREVRACHRYLASCSFIAQRIDPTSKPAREGGSQCASSPAS